MHPKSLNIFFFVTICSFPVYLAGNYQFFSNQASNLINLCVSARVSPTPRVTWSRLDSRMPSKNYNASFGQELVIDVAEFSDSGRYQCTAINTASGRPNAVVDFSLTVECMYSASYIL